MPKKKKRSSARTDFVRTSVVKEYLASKGLRTSGSTVDALNAVIKDLLNDAAMRAEDNGRLTVKASDV